MATKPSLNTLLTPPRPVDIGTATGIGAPPTLMERLKYMIASANQAVRQEWADIPPIFRKPEPWDLSNPETMMAVAGMAAPVMPTKGKLTLDISKLGKVVPLESFRSGWIKPDGTLIQLSRDADTHSLSIAKALGIAPKQGTTELPKATAEAGLVRAYAPGGERGFRDYQGVGGELGAELFSPPTDNQIRTMKQLERHHEASLSFDLAHPETGTTMATGMGTNRIRGALRDTELNYGGLWTGEDIPARGAEVTMPAKTYHEAALEKPINAAKPGTVAPKPPISVDESKLGTPVSADEFTFGWITEDGTYHQIPRSTDPDAMSHAGAIGGAAYMGGTPEHEITMIDAMGSSLETRPPRNMQAAAAKAVRVFREGDLLGAEIFHNPSNAQIRALRTLEKTTGRPVTFDLTDPRPTQSELDALNRTAGKRSRPAGAKTSPEATSLPRFGTVARPDSALAYLKSGEGVNQIKKTMAAVEAEQGPVWSSGAAVSPSDPTRVGGNNIWIRQHNLPSNKSRTLMIQFSNHMINPRSGTPTTPEQYFDKLYNSRKGYVRPDDFWEIPQWQANLSHNMRDVDSYVVRDPTEAVRFLKSAGYGNVTASALDANRDMLHELASAVPTQKFSVGGYTDLAHFNNLPNVKTYDSMPAFLKDHGVQTYKDGYDYRLFAGTPTVPRLTMSTGCLHSCAFCSMPRKVVPNSEESIMQQAAAIGLDLPSKLIYLNDKTFGQAPNYKMLPDIYKKLKAANPDFDGFIIQTTAAQMKKLSPEFLKDAGIKQVELGLESYNDPILKAMHKPANQQLMDEAADKLRGAGIDLVPNLMVGLPGETAETYANTMNWLNKNSDIISHVNVNNLTIYRDAEIANQLKPTTAADLDQNVVERSWHEDPAIHTGFYNDAAKFGSGQLDRVPFQNVTPKPEFQSAVATPGTRPTPVPSRGGTKALGLGLGAGTAALLASTGGTPQASAQTPQTPVRQRTKLSPADEAAFQTWYKDWATKSGVDTDPDSPLQKYDYRGAWLAGDRPAPGSHWLSRFKDPDHPNRFVNGVDTKTNQPQPVTPFPTWIPPYRQPEPLPPPALNFGGVTLMENLLNPPRLGGLQ